MALATSSGSAMRPSGEPAATASWPAAGTPSLCQIGFRTGPGSTALTRIDSAAHSSAPAFVNGVTAPLLEQYALKKRVPRSPVADVTLTIAPPPLRRIARTACLVSRKLESKLTDITWRQSSASSP
jgi:hypothetical protein